MNADFFIAFYEKSAFIRVPYLLSLTSDMPQFYPFVPATAHML